MSSLQLKLVSLLVQEHFGDVVEKICTHLLKNGSNNFRSVVSTVKEKPEQVKKALCVLIQHNIVKYGLNKRGMVEYTADVEKALLLVRYPRYIYSAKTLYGDIGELIVEEVLHHGEILMSNVVEKVKVRLKEAMEGNQLEPSAIKDKFIDLVNTHFLQRLPSWSAEDDEESKVIPLIPHLSVSDADLYRIPETAGVTGKRKRPLNDGGRSSKRARSSSVGSEPDQEVPLDDGIYWKVNFERFHRYFRDQDIISAITQRIDKSAGDVVATMLRMSELTTDFMARETKPLSFHDIARQMPKKLENRQLEQYMKLLLDDQTMIVKKYGDAGGGMYEIDLEQASRVICTANIESVVQERFGSKSFRIFKTLLKKKYLEQKQIENFALIPAKEAKELVYQMFAENFITVQEIPRTPDHAPSRTFYLFTVELGQVTFMLAERCYKSLINLMTRRHFESAENKRLIEKEQKVEAITASMQGSGAEPAQLEEIEKTMTQLEKEQLQKYKGRIAKLEQSELQTDKTVFVLNSFILQEAEGRL
ncbi:DNA-directed RNA polymerase III subunit RPC3-like [Strongylocentrotus purpuratus]|uniref:DNA-directed RNA polymerase III subunit RPC3 n=1 Tax=Strongylocentrotus purpuratus TaxID=7668 RepID=A0A7M7NAK0_STRPU|nr:DNA-directed RNA polymerase III subunit RPC3 [Strongylocentrotus purpuratus]XP_030832773.1 DNA-directed RNA polymerase III subunit RPC3-like [Strongylocentrotus purpuratus]|eukprot:XP_011677192.1 PREDICTED: DNA-directed RNA polymerase III subunit RPC3-like [Strongylocentrotus purpuratus]